MELKTGGRKYGKLEHEPYFTFFFLEFATPALKVNWQKKLVISPYKPLK